MQKPEEVLKIVGAIIGVETDEFRKRRRNVRARALASYYLTCHAGLTQRDVAEYLSVGTGSAVGKQIKQLVNERGKDHTLAKIMERIETGLKDAKSSKSRAAKS